MVIELLRPIEAKGSLETVKRLSQRLNEIITYGVNSGQIFANPLSGIRAVFKKPKKQENMSALRPDELSELMIEIANASIKRITRRLIERQLHTMTVLPKRPPPDGQTSTSTNTSGPSRRNA